MYILLRDQGIIIWAVVIIIALGTSVRVIWETRSPSKTAAYLLLIILFPIGGPILYFLVGINYRKRHIYNKKLIRNEALLNQIRTRIQQDTAALKKEHAPTIGPQVELVDLLLGESMAPLSRNNVTLLINGEEKFPALLEALEHAQHFIHVEYYIFEDDDIGTQIKSILIKKAKEGVDVRVIFDDFGSHDLWDEAVGDMRRHGVQIFPFYRIHFMLLANRLNYRDHRKVVIIDGTVGFVGGLNIADRYINNDDNEYWRDTHVKIEGPAVLTLQYHFLSNWNFCSDESLGMEPRFFPDPDTIATGDDLVQIVTGGPDYPRPSIMLSYFTAIMTAQKSVYITSPYFIPNESIHNAIKKAAFSGKDVRILLPRRSDSAFVDAASRFYFQELLEAGAKIYLYEKGFIHAKTMVVDDNLSIVGTANMDMRSFDLNFEINAVIYSKSVNRRLTEFFHHDLQGSRVLQLSEWRMRNKFRAFIDALARILAPLL